MGEERRRERARERIEAAVSASSDLAGIAESLGGVVDTTAEFHREAFVPGVGRRNSFVAAAFLLSPGQTSDILETDRGYYVLEVLERIPADEEGFTQQRDMIRQQLLLQKRRSLITAWTEKLIREAEILDYRTGRGVVWEPDPELFRYGGA